MKNIVIAVTFVVLFAASSVLAQTACTRHYEPAGRFSYCPPSDWVAKTSSSGGPYKTFTTQPGSQLIANMNVKEEKTRVSNSEYMAAALKLMLAGNSAKGSEAVKVVGWTDFVTTSNIRGSKVIYESFYQGIQLRIVQYVLDLPGKKLLFTGTSRESDKDVTEWLFDAAAMSLKMNP
jgi:hypothetical protein